MSRSQVSHPPPSVATLLRKYVLFSLTLNPSLCGPPPHTHTHLLDVGSGRPLYLLPPYPVPHEPHNSDLKVVNCIKNVTVSLSPYTVALFSCRTTFVWFHFPMSCCFYWSTSVCPCRVSSSLLDIRETGVRVCSRSGEVPDVAAATDTLDCSRIQSLHIR